MRYNQSSTACYIKRVVKRIFPKTLYNPPFSVFQVLQGLYICIVYTFSLNHKFPYKSWSSLPRAMFFLVEQDIEVHCWEPPRSWLKKILKFLAKNHIHPSWTKSGSSLSRTISILVKQNLEVSCREPSQSWLNKILKFPTENHLGHGWTKSRSSLLTTMLVLVEHLLKFLIDKHINHG